MIYAIPFEKALIILLRFTLIFSIFRILLAMKYADKIKRNGYLRNFLYFIPTRLIFRFLDNVK